MKLRRTWLAIVAALGSATWAVAAGGVTDEDIAVAVGEQKQENATTAFLGQAARKVVAKGKDQMLSSLKAQAKAWVNEQLDEMSPNLRRTVLQDTLKYLDANKADLDGVVKAGLDRKKDEVLAKTGGLLANALEAATERLEDSDDPELQKLLQAGKGIKELIEPVQQLSKGAGYLAEGRYADAGKEFALVIPGVKKTRDTVVQIVEVERKAYYWLQDQGQESVYQAFQKGAYSSREDLELLITGSVGFKNMLSNMKLRHGWKSDEEALRNLHRGFLARRKAEAAAAKQAATDKRLLRYAAKRRLLTLPEPLPPKGPKRTAALREALKVFKHHQKGLKRRLEAASGLSARKWRGSGHLFRLHQLMRAQKLAMARGDWKEARRLRRELRKELLARAKELKDDEARTKGKDPCDAIPPEQLERFDQELLAAGKHKFAKLARVRLKEDSQKLLSCICRVHSGASVGVSVQYKPGGDDCGGAKGGPCLSQGWGCWRKPLQADAKALASCRASNELARDFCLEAAR
jgi:hypothetical protein